MSKDAFHEPRLAINRVYTRQGDGGETRLAGGQSVSKDCPRIEAYGTVDELNSFLGAARVTAAQAGLPQLSSILLRVQHELFNLGSILATLPEDVHPKQPRVTEVETARLEAEMDAMNQDLEPLRSFVLPGGSRIDAELHIARTVCRRAERACIALNKQEGVPAEAIRYLNRLSDALFVWSRWAGQQTGAAETLWQPNQSASGE
jgi:cob(I)alamin adenosyltransferase